MRFNQVPYALTTVLLLAALGCTKKEAAPGSEAQSASVPSGDVIRVGEVGSMTGSEATFGQSSHNGSALAFEEINAAGGIGGKRIELITLDDQGKSNEAALAVENLIDRHKVVAILGEVASSRSIAMGAVAQRKGVPMVSPSSINSRVTQAGDFVFRVCFLDRFQAEVMSRFALGQLKAKKAAILKDVKSDYSVDLTKYTDEHFKANGGQIVAIESYTGNDLDFRAQLTSLKSKNPDVVFVPGYYTDIGTMSKQAKEVGLKAPLIGGDGWDSPELKSLGGTALDGSYFVSHFSQTDTSPLVQAFIKKYQERHGVIPDGLAALGYDAAMVLADSLKRAKSVTASDIRDSIAATRDYVGVTGKITIGKDRNAIKPAIVFKLANGGAPEQLVRIDP